MFNFNPKELEIISKGLYELQRKIFKEMEEDNFDNDSKENYYYQIEDLKDFIDAHIFED